MAEYSTADPGGKESTDGALPLRNVIAAVRNRWWLIGIVFVLVVSFSLWRVTRTTRIYRAGATVRIQEPLSPVAGVQSQSPRDWRIDLIQTEQTIIKSQEIAERAAQMIGAQLIIVEPQNLKQSDLFGIQPPVVDTSLHFGDYVLRLASEGVILVQGGRQLASVPYGQAVSGGGLRFVVPARPRIDQDEVRLAVIPLTAAGGRLRGGLTTRGVPQTNIVWIEYSGPDPVVVMQAANAVAQSYAAYSTEQRSRQAQFRTRSTQDAVTQQRLRLTAAQDSLRYFKENAQISSTLAEQQAFAEKIQRAESEREIKIVELQNYTTLVGKLAAADTASEELRKLAGTGASANRQVQSLFERWFELQKERAQVMAPGRNERYYEVAALDKVISQVKRDLREASSDYVASLRSTIATLDARIAEMRRGIQRYPELEAREQRLVADVGTAQALYGQLLADLQRARIAENTEAGYVQVIDDASQPTAPVSPNRRRVFLTAVILGLLIGVGVAVVVENFDDSVKSPEEVRDQLGLPVVGTIPAIRADSLAPGNGKGEGITEEVARRLVTHLDPRSPVAESYRSLRTNLAFARANEALRVIVLTSPGPADGKSTTVANLAITFAQQGQRTLLIDGDLRRAVLDRMFGVPRAPGLTDVLVGHQRLPDVVRATDIDQLYVLGSGPFPPNPSELLGSARMRDVLQEAQQSYDVVLIDSPPLLAVTDAAVLSTMADGAILVIRMGNTARTAVRRAVAQLYAVHGRVVGAVLNDVDFRHGAFSGSYGYYYYYYYGEGGRNGRVRGAAARLRRLVRRGLSTRDRV